ncbi:MULTISPECIES: phage terminase small subunit P27 family [unclassified Blautia]|uniref:phage terminase small subunit P27 family n=1 Tax=unclassified Blautia TaxID=2648079 RepID=UPI003F8A9DA0
MAGRKPKPTAVKMLEGNPGKRKLNTKEPTPGKGMPDCPKWLLPEAKEEWNRLCEKLNQMGVLTEIDRSAFAAYCQSYARWKEAQDHINSEGATYETENGMKRPNPYVAISNTEQRLMMSAASEFGLTPSARSRIMAASSANKNDVDEMEALLGGDS